VPLDRPPRPATEPGPSTRERGTQLVEVGHAALLASLARARAGLGRGARRSVERHAERLASSGTRLERAAGLLVERRRAGVERSAAKLRALSPLATLERGYAIVRHEGVVVRSAVALAVGDDIDVRVADGGVSATVTEGHA